jgi:hypothetical protein
MFPVDFSAVLVQPLSATPRLETQVELLSDPGASGQFIQPIAAALQNFVSRQLAAGVPGKLVAQWVDTLSAAAPDAQRDDIKAQSRERANDGITDVARVALTNPDGMVIEKLPSSFHQNIPGYTVIGEVFCLDLSGNPAGLFADAGGHSCCAARLGAAGVRRPHCARTRSCRSAAGSRGALQIWRAAPPPGLSDERLQAR